MIGHPARKTIWPFVETFVSRSSANDVSSYIYKCRLGIYWRPPVQRLRDFIPAISLDVFQYLDVFFCRAFVDFARRLVVYWMY